MDLEAATYNVADTYFGQPYIDRDEWRDTPIRHRNVHGGFTGTDTRFTFYFPPPDEWAGRMYHPLEGAHAGHEEVFGGFMGELIGGLSLIARLGGYMVESNSGHIGDDVDPVGGDDPTIYGHRASIETARFSKHVAAQVYGRPPHHSYVWGGSGGGRRSPLCLEYGPDVYDGALPFMGGGEICEWGSTQRIRGAPGDVVRVHVQRTAAARREDRRSDRCHGTGRIGRPVHRPRTRTSARSWRTSTVRASPSATSPWSRHRWARCGCGRRSPTCCRRSIRSTSRTSGPSPAMSATTSPDTSSAMSST